MAETISPQIRPAVPFAPDLSAQLDGEPAHLRFAFDQEDLPELGGVFPGQAQLLIYPVQAYRDIYQGLDDNPVSQRIEALQTLLEDQPETVDGAIPVLPGFGDAGQNLKAQLKYLEFDGGSGLRFITHYGFDEAPITDHNTFYTFQGLTDDGQYYIAYYHPASTDLLPSSFGEVTELIEDYDEFIENFDTYLEETAEQLDQADTGDFEPDLTNLDGMLETLRVQP